MGFVFYFMRWKFFKNIFVLRWLCKLFDKALVCVLALWGFGNVLANWVTINNLMSVQLQNPYRYHSVFLFPYFYLEYSVSQS